MNRTKSILFALLVGGSLSLGAKTVYVNCNFDDYTGHDGSTPEKALKTLVEATGYTSSFPYAAGDGDTVIVAEGVYDEGYSNPTTWWGDTRIHIEGKKLYIKASGAAEKTIIEGVHSTDTIYGYGAGAIRCVTVQGAVAAQSIIEGFTLRNGSTLNASNISGAGGAVCSSSTGTSPYEGGPYLVGCVIENCTGKRASLSYGGTFVRCRIRGCQVQAGQYLCWKSTFVNSLITRVTADTGTGWGTAHFDQSRAINCTFADNYASIYPTGTSYFYNNIISFTSNLAQGGAAGNWDGNFTDSDSIMALISPVYGDVRIRTGVTAVQVGNADYLGSGHLTLPSGEAPWNIDPYVDLYGNAIPKSGTIAAGACQTTADPIAGTVKLATARMVTDGQLHNADTYFAPTNYPMSVRVTYRPGTTTRVIHYTSNYNGTNYRQCPLLGDGDPVDVIPPPSGTSGVLTASVGRSSSNIVWADPEADADIADGSEEHPYPTIQGALDAAMAVDTTGIIRCKKGTYKPGANNEGVSSFSWNGTSGYTMIHLPPSKNYRFIAEEGPEKTFIMGKADPATGTYGANAVNFAAGFGLGFIQGFTITGCYSSTDGNGDFWTTGRGIYYTYGTDFEIHDCIVSNNTGSCYIMSVGRCYRCKVLNNTAVSGVFGQGNIVASCVVARNTVSSGVVFDGEAKVYGCSVDGLGVGTAFANNPHAVIVNTAVDNGGSSVFTNGGHYGCVYNGFTNWGASNYLKADPYFADVPQGDLRMAWVSKGVTAAVGPEDDNASRWWLYAMTDTDGNPMRFDSAGRPLPGAYASGADGVVVAAEQGSIAVADGKVGFNALGPSDTLTVSAGTGTRPVAGLVVNGVTNLFEDLADHALTWSGADGNTLIEALYLNTWYCAPSGDDSASGFYPSAAKTLQGALSNANLISGDTVLAMPGTYDSGTMLSGVELNARAVVPAGVTLASAEGRDVTFIRGRAADIEDEESPEGRGLGVGAIRCVHLNTGSKLRGFTVFDGHTRYIVGTTGTDLHSGPETTGGGVGAYFASRNASWVEDCVISNCAAYRGGGAMAVRAKNCVFANNYGHYLGGGASDSTLYGCLSHDNACRASSSVENRGFGYTYSAEQCSIFDGMTFANNTSSILRNCLINGYAELLALTATNLSRCAINTHYVTGVTNEWLATTDGCIAGSNDDFAYDVGTYRPAIGANLAIDAANPAVNTVALGDTDALGGQRVYNGALDIGAVEADWRMVYATDIGSARYVAVDFADSQVVESSSKNVRLPPGSSLLVTLSSSGRKGSYIVSASVAGSGTLTILVNGEILDTQVGAGAKEIRFSNALDVNQLSFEYAGDDGYAEILTVRSGNISLLRIK